MSRSKSPTYPNFSLRKALKYAEAIFSEDRRNAIDRAVVGKHMGYTSLSGAADKSISSMMQYGLLEKVGKGEVRISQTSIDILHPDKESDRKEALGRAAFSPPLFKTLKARFADDKFSEEALRSFLMREGFLDRAISPIFTAYSDTIAFLQQEKANESGGFTDGLSEESGGSDEDETKFGGAAVGDLVQWESSGVLQLPSPKRVRFVSPDGDWVFVEGSETGIPMAEVVVEQKGVAATAKVVPPTLPLSDQSHPKGTRKEVFALDEGDVILTFPENLSTQSYEDLEAYFALFLKKAKRRAEILD